MFRQFLPRRELLPDLSAARSACEPTVKGQGKTYTREIVKKEILRKYILPVVMKIYIVAYLNYCIEHYKMMQVLADSDP